MIKPSELANISKIPDKLTMMSYLSQLYECFRREIPANNPRNSRDFGNNMESIPEDEKQTMEKLGQMAAKTKRKRKSRENNANDTKEDIDQLLKVNSSLDLRNFCPVNRVCP